MDKPLVSRLLLASGLLLAIAGLAGFWLTRGPAGTPLSEAQRKLLGVEEDDFHASFVVAGRDILYGSGETEPVYDEAGRIVCWKPSGSRSAYGVNTDTIIYAGLKNSELTLILLPRDLFVQGGRKINGVYARGGADGLRQTVSDLLGVPVDYHAIINLDIFQRLVDALGGVEVNIPARMYHRDCTADLTIDLPPGLQHLDGVEASHFVRYRGLLRGDIDRLENVKTLAYALLARVKELHLRAVSRLPDLLETYLDEVETNVDMALLMRRVLPRLGSLRIESAGTLPTTEATRNGTAGVEVDPKAVEEFLAGTFGGRVRPFGETPAVDVLITDRSGVAGLGEWYRRRLAALGVPEQQLTVRTAAGDSTPTRVVATVATWGEAEYYAGLLHLGRQQVDRFTGERAGTGIEIVLGEDAYAGPHAPSRSTPMDFSP